MNIKDEFAGIQGKCPQCKRVLTVPSPAAPSTSPPPPASPAPLPAPVPAMPPQQEVQFAKVDPVQDPIAEEVFEATVEKGGASRNPPPSFTERPVPARRRREDEEEEDRYSRRGPARRRGRYEEEDFKESEGPQISRAERDGWKKARVGVVLNQVTMWLYTAIWGIVLLGFFLLCTMGIGEMSNPRGREPSSALNFAVLLNHVTNVLWIGVWIVSLIGYIFAIMTPGRNGEKGLAITALAMLVAAMVLRGVLFFTSEFRFAATFRGPEILETLRGILVLTLLLYLLEVARNTIYAIYIHAVGRTLRSRRTRQTGQSLFILVPALCLSVPLIDYLLIRFVAVESAAAGPQQPGNEATAGIIVLVTFLGTVGSFLFLSIFYGVKLGRPKRTIEEFC
jgi:hypothetical protein